MFAQYAFELHQLGWNVIPLSGKKPITSQWTNYSVHCEVIGFLPDNGITFHPN